MIERMLEEKALQILRAASPDILRDAKEGARVHNSIVGAVLAMETQSPRWACESAVLSALAHLKRLKAAVGN